MKAAMTGYDRVSRVNHWVLAALMIGMLIMGVYVFRVLPAGLDKGALVGMHKSLGVLVLVLALVLHVLGAMKHALYDRDGTMARVAPKL